MGTVIIGDGDKGNSSVAIHIEPGNYSISQNKVSFWICLYLFDHEMVVFKDNEHGEKLNTLLENESPRDEIYDFLSRLFLANVEPCSIRTRMENIMKISFERGKKAKAQELRRVLGISEDGFWS